MLVLGCESMRGRGMRGLDYTLLLTIYVAPLAVRGIESI